MEIIIDTDPGVDDAPARVDVAVGQKLPERGQTTATWDEGSSIQISRSVDVARARSLVLETLGGTGAVS